MKVIVQSKNSKISQSVDELDVWVSVLEDFTANLHCSNELSWLGESTDYESHSV